MTRASTLILGSSLSTSGNIGEQCAQCCEILESFSDAVSANLRMRTSSGVCFVMQYHFCPVFFASGVCVYCSSIYSPLSTTLLVARYSIGWRVSLSVVRQSATARGSRFTGLSGLCSGALAQPDRCYWPTAYPNRVCSVSLRLLVCIFGIKSFLCCSFDVFAAVSCSTLETFQCVVYMRKASRLETSIRLSSHLNLSAPLPIYSLSLHLPQAVSLLALCFTVSSCLSPAFR
jgi:hypothetical protein